MKTPNRNIGHMIIESSWISNSNSWAFLSTSVVNEKRIKGKTMKPMKNGRKLWFLVPIIEDSEGGSSFPPRFSSPTNLVILSFKMKCVYCIILSPTSKMDISCLFARVLVQKHPINRFMIMFLILFPNQGFYLNHLYFFFGRICGFDESDPGVVDSLY